MSNVTESAQKRGIWQRALGVLDTNTWGLHPRLHVYNLVASLVVPRAGAELRARLLSLVGFQVGTGTRITGPLKISGTRRLKGQLTIGADCWLGPEVILDLVERVTIGDRVTIEPGVMVLTSTHELDLPEHRAGPLIKSPVVIGDGALLRARSIILPGVKIGAGAVVEAGSVVNKDVAPNARVGGSPAVQLEVLAAP
jgi:maltose O-acetyltransferase